ncbi:hypothetical protein So717_16680 [Roseobacter cerasinus]|uniref:DUF924 domain-containing protein n=1 Tax=Roseobacter cerasinus TaxID=2602289 RepID=A0A640VSP2_9RHOB|nr:DUF924 family protein [Roseobacter cerasinus]GFE49915.1 hypothetical protein So717_16680 [Roseobacter cerasinus]
MVSPDEILSFWLDEVGPDGWYKQSDALDATIRTRFEETWHGACEGRFSLWLTYPSGALAYIILMDQLSRNMFRGSAKAFASDRVALAAAKSAIDKNWDLKIDEPARQFFYLPLMHSENLCDQERCVRLMCERMPEHGASNLLHAQAHRAVIREFGRFPFRNEALARTPTPAETAFAARGGYGDVLRSLELSRAA